MKIFVKKILLRIIVVLLTLISAMYLFEKINDDWHYLKYKKQAVINSDNSKTKNVKLDNAQNYIIINKNCASCINDRKGNAGCIVAKDNKILLVRYRRTNKINLPGGFRDYLHRDTFVASEEIRNAVGYIVSIEDIIKDFNPIVGISRDSNFRLYKCKIVAKTEKTNSKIIEKIWVDKKKLYNLLYARKDVDFTDELKFVYSKFEYLTK